MTKNTLTFNSNQSEGKNNLSSLNFSSPKDIFSFSTSSLAIEEAEKHNSAFSSKPFLLDSPQGNLTQGHDGENQTLDQVFSWHETAVTDNTGDTSVSNASLAQVNIQNDLVTFGNNTYESLIPIKPFQSNDFGSFQSDFQPSKIESNALGVNNFEPPASNQVGIFYEAATDAEFAQAAGTKTQLELPSEFDYVDIASDALPGLTPEIHDGRLIERHPEITPVTIATNPQANPDTNSYTEGSGTPVTGNVLTNDNTNNGGNLMVVTPGIYTGTFGDLTLNQDGTYIYTPHDPSTDPATLQALNTPGTHQDMFTYTDTNASGATTSSILTMTIATNPQANPDTNSYTEGSGTPVTGNVLTNDNTNNGGNLMVVTPGIYTGTFGDLTLNQDGTYIYTPHDPSTDPATLQALNTPGTHQDMFTYTDTNASGATTSSILTMTIATNPQANPDTNSYTEGSGTPVTGNVLTNDNTNNGGNLMVVTPGIYTGTFGDLTLNQDGTYIYTPHDPSTDPATLQALNTPGTHQDMFTYTDTNASGATTSSILTMTIATNPQANPDTNSYTEGSGTPVTGNVLTNDNTNNGGNLMVVTPGIYTGTFGDLTLNQDGTYIYTPHDPSTDPATLQALNTPGTHQDMFTYTDTNASGATTSSILTMTIATNPQANPDYLVLSEPNITGNQIFLLNILRNDNDGGEILPLSVHDIINNGPELTISGISYDLTSVISSDPTIVAEYAFTYNGQTSNLTIAQNGDVYLLPYKGEEIFGSLLQYQQAILSFQYNNTDDISISNPSSFVLLINGVHQQPVPESNYYTFYEPNMETSISSSNGFVVGNIITDPKQTSLPFDPLTNPVDTDPQKALLSVKSVTLPTLHINTLGQDVDIALNPVNVLANSSDIAEYQFNVDGNLGVISISESGDLRLTSQTPTLFSVIDQENSSAIFNFNYTITDQYGIDSLPPAGNVSFEIHGDFVVAIPDYVGLFEKNVSGNSVPLLNVLESGDSSTLHYPLTMLDVLNPSLTINNVSYTLSSLTPTDSDIFREYSFVYNNQESILTIGKNGLVNLLPFNGEEIFKSLQVGENVDFIFDYRNTDGFAVSPTDDPAIAHFRILGDSPVANPNTYITDVNTLESNEQLGSDGNYYSTIGNIISNPQDISIPFNSISNPTDIDSNNSILSVNTVTNAFLTINGTSEALTTVSGPLFSGVIAEYQFTLGTETNFLTIAQDGKISLVGPNTNFLQIIERGENIKLSFDYQDIDSIHKTSNTAHVDITINGDNLPSLTESIIHTTTAFTVDSGIVH